MDPSSILLTGFSILLLSFATLFGSNKVENPTFQQYKSIFFTAAMFLFLGLLGLPFLPSDAVHRPPSFELIFTSLGVLALFGSIFIYIMNMSFDNFVVFVATFVSVATVVGKLRGEGPVEGTGMHPLVKDALIGASLIALFFGTGKLATKYQTSVQTPWVQQTLLLYSYAAPVGIGGILVYLVYKAIRSLAETRASNTTPAPIPASKRRFEGFQGTQAIQATQATKTPTSLPERLEFAINRLQESLTRITDFSDSTCSIVREVELGFMGARSAPKDDSELSLPAEVQAERRKTRQDLAKKSFLTLRKINANAMGTKILECFQDADDDIREYCIQLEGLLENSESLAQIAKVQSMTAELVFADRMIQKADEVKETFQDLEAIAEEIAPSEAPSAAISESIVEKYNKLSGPMLETAANVLLQKEYLIYTFAENLEKVIDVLEGKIGKANKKANMVATGNYDASSPEMKQAELRMSLTKSK